MSEALDFVPDDWGPKVQTEGAAVTLTRRGPDRIQFQAPAHLAVILLTRQPVRETSLATDRRTRFAAPIGSLEIIPAEADFFGQWSTPKENILFGIEPQKLTQIAQTEFGKDSFELRPPSMAMIDSKALQIAQLLRVEFQRGPHVSQLYIDSLLTIMSIHLLRHYSNLSDETSAGEKIAVRGRLARQSWREVQSCMHENLTENLTIAKLAKLAGLSNSHFLRVFRETTGKSPHQYLLELRVQRAEQLILATDQPLKVIAQQSGFSSQSHMTAAMRQLRLTTPGEIRGMRSFARSKSSVAATEDDGV
ncbi:helix-turn-helix domain-containing protein [Beijerinckia indica]|uniref:Transcriptional regulator, AraC family n=1 Tax=Beijerinckia indica subsp. indica (strain ATCC 9039 / DSM 1715 / NCIMB 8712) TaxID=395963 RepID=B2IFP7_BEII9|nr:AraC family transcriptional regulator [Beijerinckia indica]ACB94258.1 transcriptional regulator, AraC family [Beijerinckia indica subsp. indica ATCC 9039]